MNLTLIESIASTVSSSRFCFALLGLIVISGGCRSTRPTALVANQAFASGDLITAAETLRTQSESSKQQRESSSLDLALVELASGNASSAESRLRGLRDHFDARPTVSVHDAASLVSDDRARQFSLAAYEDVVLRTMLAICSLSSGSGDSTAYLLQAQSKQRELAETLDANEDGPQYTTHVALAPYLHGVIREASYQNFDDAERSFRLVSQIEPDFLPAEEDIRRASEGHHSASGHGVLYVVSFVGVGPQRVETVAPTTTLSLQIASRLIRTLRQDDDEEEDDNPVLPNIASVKVPTIIVPESPIAAIGVRSTAAFLGATQTLTHVGRMAEKQSQAEMPWTIARAVARRVLKESSVAAVSRSAGLSGNAASLFEFAASSAWSGVERADTRCWSLLPREFQVLRAELPKGKQAIELLPLGPNGQLVANSAEHTVTIEDGRNHFLFVFAPSQIVSVVDSAF